jgi:hypothetical protein
MMRRARRSAKANFLRFVHEIELLNVSCDLLVLCPPPKINNDTGICQGSGAKFVPTMRVLKDRFI